MIRIEFKRLIVGCGVVLGLLLTASVSRADSDSEIIAKINELIKQGWEDNEVKPSERASDAEFARRSALDIAGQIPEYQELVDFLDDESRDKRQRWIDEQLDDPGYIRSFTSIWGDKLVGRQNNNGGGRAALNQWLRNTFRVNLPYDQFVRDLVSASGNSEENGAVVFLASHLNEMAVPATAITAKLFLGRQVQCTQCHNHPFNDWQQSQFWGMNAFFRGTQRQGRGNMGGIMLTDNPAPLEVDFEKRNGTTIVTSRMFFDGTRVTKDASTGDFTSLVKAGVRTTPVDEEAAATRPRQQLANFILDKEKPYMAETQVNRMWGHFFGYGFTKPIDDMGPHNPSSHPELLPYLSKQFQEAGYDNKRLIRWITNSDAYNLTSQGTSENTYDNPAAGEMPLFSHMYLKLFRAAQLYDSLLIATAADESGRSGDQAERQRQTWLRQFVQTFGTDENDEATTFNGTIPQALLLMNGGLTNSALNGGRGSTLQAIITSKSGKPNEKVVRPKTARAARLAAIKAAKSKSQNIPDKIESLFLVALSRRPTASELDAFNNAYVEAGYTDPVVGLQDVFWALINSNEFIINHRVL